MDLLGTHLTYPLERVYKAWIVGGVEAYFAALGVRHAVFAVTPTVESTWPADEVVSFFGKILGLQVKQPSTEQHRPNDFGRLRWYLNQPGGQSRLIQQFPEIYSEEVPVNWSKWIRQIHRWLAIAFTVSVIVTFVALGQEKPVVWVSYVPLFPLALLLFSGLYLFVLPYAAKWRSGRRTD